MSKFITFIVLSSTAALLAGCSSTGSSMGSLFAKEEPKIAQPALEPIEPIVPDATIARMSQSEIRKVIAGKSWRWQGPNNSGVTLYANDGTSLVEVDGKGTTKGKWQAKDGQLCESFSPAPFLPGGVPMSCAPINGKGSTYTVGKARFTLA
jgi:Protein of unknown function (DUF995)